MRVDLIHQGPLLRVRDVRCDAGRGGFGAEEHSPRATVVFPRRGTFVKRGRGGEIAADATRVLRFGAGESYRIAHPCDGGDRCIAIEPRGRLAAEIEMSPAGDAPPLDPRVARDLQRLLLAIDAGAEPLRIEEDGARLVSAAIERRPARRDRAAASAAARRRRADLAAAARDALHRRFDRRVRLDELCAELATSPFHLCRVFRAEAGETLHRTHVRLRLLAALDRLRDGERDLTRLALSLGFFDHAHFTNAFRAEFRCAPSDLRASKGVQARSHAAD